MSESDAALVESISTHARNEAATAAKRLAAIAELATRRLGSDLARDRERWACDAWDSAAAEVAAELTIGHRAASAMMHQALDLRDRLPCMGSQLARGDIPLRVATSATFRTGLIEDDELLARVDAELVAKATRFGKMSERKLVDSIDEIIGKHDPDAVRRFRTAQKGLDVRFGKPDDDAGTRSVFGRMTATDAELSDRRLEAVAKSVCRDDPRTHGERRAAAWAILSAGGDLLPCLCGESDCPATGPDARAQYFEILVLTDDPHAGEDPTGDEPDDGPDEPETDPGTEQCAAPPCPYTSMIAAGGALPAPLLAELRRMGVAVRPVLNSSDLVAIAGYRPTVAQQRFVRARDMTCCFPGCDHPAERCDTDHTIPYETSRLTHPGNLKALCRKHHLLKTFWVGRGGWTDEQLSDGTIVWTTPTGRRKVVSPGSRMHYPDWDTTTPLPDTASTRRMGVGRGLTMPLRKRTRAQQHQADVRAERARNRALDVENPPPF